MPEPSTEPEIHELAPQTVALVHGRVPLDQFGSFLGGAFEEVAQAAGANGVTIMGAPISVYHSIEQGIAEVGAGFPVDGPIAADGIEITELPGGRAAQLLHRGPYDDLGEVWQRLMDWMEREGHRGGPLTWESYVNDPDPGAPQDTQTLLTWPLD